MMVLDKQILTQLRVASTMTLRIIPWSKKTALLTLQGRILPSWRPLMQFLRLNWSILALYAHFFPRVCLINGGGSGGITSDGSAAST